jgi:ABC-type nitrate/sulfonate/bicarbonate transport system substrate-binding protein
MTMQLVGFVSRAHRWTAVAATAVAVAVLMATPASAQIKVTIGTAKDPNLGAQIAIARDKGYFKEAGLDAEVRYFPSGGDLVAAFVGGSVQMGSSGATPTTILRARPYPLKTVAQISDNSGAQQLIVKQGVNAAGDLAGKKIAVFRGTGSEALFNAFSKAYAFDPAKAEIVNMAPAEMVQAFVRGTVDAIAVWEPHATLARKAGKGRILATATHSYFNGTEHANRIHGEHATLFASEAFIREQPATVRAVLVALLKATEFIDKNRTEAIQMLVKEFGLDAADMADVVGANRYTLSLDEELVSDLNKLSDFLLALKRIPAAVRATDWIDPGPLRALRPDLVKLK